MHMLAEAAHLSVAFFRYFEKPLSGGLSHA
jgi:hypothetical protein